MSLVSFKEIHDGRDGSIEVTTNNRTTRQYTRVFRCVTDNVYDNAATILGVLGIVIGNPHPDDPGAWCRAIKPSQHAGKLVWIVTFDYSSEREIFDNPLSDPVDIEWGGENYQRPVFEAYDPDTDTFKAVVNSAGLLPSEPLMMDDSHLVVNISSNQANIPTWVMSYRNAVNDGPITIDGFAFSARQCKINDLRISKLQFRNDIPYRTFSVEIQGREETWDFKLRNTGYHEYDTLANHRHVKIVLPDGTTPSTPWPLTDEGFAVRHTSSEGPITFDDWSFKTYRVYREKDFTVLPGIT